MENLCVPDNQDPVLVYDLRINLHCILGRVYGTLQTDPGTVITDLEYLLKHFHVLPLSARSEVRALLAEAQETLAAQTCRNALAKTWNHCKHMPVSNDVLLKMLIRIWIQYVLAMQLRMQSDSYLDLLAAWRDRRQNNSFSCLLDGS